jgi:hypothetical protein
MTHVDSTCAAAADALCAIPAVIPPPISRIDPSERPTDTEAKTHRRHRHRKHKERKMDKRRLADVYCTSPVALSRWLEEYDPFITKFARDKLMNENVDGMAFTQINDGDLKDLNISLGQRKHILLAIASACDRL